MKLYGFCCFGTNITNPRISTPSLREIGPHALRPFNIATPLGSNFAFVDESSNPLPIKRLEGVDVQATNTDAGAQVAIAELLLMVRYQPRPTGEFRRILVTGATTLVANTWTTVPLTFTDVLPMGVYAVVGMQAFGATLYAARLSFPGSGNGYRPGVPCVQTVGQRVPAEMEYMDLGEWGRFNQASLPVAECLATAGDTAQSFWLDLIKVT